MLTGLKPNDHRFMSWSVDSKAEKRTVYRKLYKISHFLNLRSCEMYV